MGAPFTPNGTAHGHGATGIEQGAPLPAAYWEHHYARGAAIAPMEWRIPGLLPVGLTVLVAPPKIGKTWLAMQVEHCLTLRAPLFGHAPKHLMNTLAIDLEGHLPRTQVRSNTLTPHLPVELSELHTDTLYVHSAFDGILEHNDRVYNLPNYAACANASERIAWLDAMLTVLENYGKPIGHVRIDTLRLFLGSKPPQMNAYDFDAAMGRRLDELALRRQISILAVHHTKKSNAESSDDWLERVSGSTGIAGSASGIWLLERNRGASEGVLSASLRDGEEIESPVRFVNGRWSFTDEITPAQARHTGVPRQILDVLVRFPDVTLAELRAELGIAQAKDKPIRQALMRLQDLGEIRQMDGVWSMIDSPAAIAGSGRTPGQLPLPLADDPAGEPETAPEPPAEPQPVAEDPPEDKPAQNGSEDPGEAKQGPGVTKAIGVLFDGIATARAHTVPLIGHDHRGDMPWSIAWGPGAVATGRHAWTATLAEEVTGTVVILDRNGAYPSVMSSVPVASSTLTHTGAAPYDPKRSGIYLATWDPADMPGPSPLGVARPGQWVSTPHIRLLEKLRIPYTIDDSWTGRTATKLFEPFYKWARELRQHTSDDPEAHAAGKRAVSMAIRSLHWSKPNRLWRPDWYTAIVAEANVRHWIGAQKAMVAGRRVVQLGGTDEVALLVDVAADDLAGVWASVEPYQLGWGYGEVKIKAVLPLAEWVANGGRAERPVTDGAVTDGAGR